MENKVVGAQFSADEILERDEMVVQRTERAEFLRKMFVELI